MSKNDEQLGKQFRQAVEGEKISKLLLRIVLWVAVLVLAGMIFISIFN